MAAARLASVVRPAAAWPALLRKLRQSSSGACSARHALKACRRSAQREAPRSLASCRLHSLFSRTRFHVPSA
eukprot:5531179-Lingulodinium_polyedra.AAC.1